MFKQEVDRHNKATAKKSLSQTLFPSSSPPMPKITSALPKAFSIVASSVGKTAPRSTRPLSTGSANVVRTNPGMQTLNTLGSAGTKRSASGLAKALRIGDGFEETNYPEVNSQHNPIVIDSPGNNVTSSFDHGVYFDENDFESDVDLDLEVEDPAAKGRVDYPTLPPAPSSPPATRSTLSPTVPRQSAYSTATQDYGYESQIPPHHTPSQLRSTPAHEVYDWSSSPLEHLKPSETTKTPAWHRFAYKGSAASAGGIGVPTSRQVKAAHNANGHYQPALNTGVMEEEEQSRPTKRRMLPWKSKAEEADKSGLHSANTGKNLSTKGDFTPLSKTKMEFPWNTTASAMKEQQKQMRQANKKLSKTHEASEAERSAAIEAKKKTQFHKVFLSEEQQHILNLVSEHKKSVFFTGSAGTGKSVLLREIIGALRKKYSKEPDRVAVTASTGLAACNVGGVTLHSFAGIGLGKEDVPTLVKKIRRNQKARHRWMRTKVLIMDEVSMVDGELFDKLEEIARTLRNNGRPFGGIQLVITGDFFQLPPVPDHSQKASRFAFEAATWNTSIEHTIALHHVFRQKDPEFAAMLNEMREGRLSQQSISRFRSLNRAIKFEDELEATELFPTRTEVERANAARMRNLQGEPVIFDARDGGTITEKTLRDKLLQNCICPEIIQLKKGAQVMLIKNIDDTLVNGSLGKVVGFMSEAMFDNYQAHEEEYYATQGAEGALGGPELSERKMKLNEIAAGSGQVYPVVRFAIADGSTRDLLCQRETWKVELPNGEVQASRSQIPLILAWALSIHKAQGQTLERVKVDLGRVFEKGQAYVALSRATSMKGLQVMNFSANKIMAHDKVRNFYAGLSRLEAGGPKIDVNMKKQGKGEGRGLGATDYEQQFVSERYLQED